MKFKKPLTLLVIFFLGAFIFANLHYIQHKIVFKKQIEYIRQSEQFRDYQKDFQDETMKEIARHMRVQGSKGTPYCWCVYFEQRMTKYADGKLYWATKNGWKRISKRLVMKRFIDKYDN